MQAGTKENVIERAEYYKGLLGKLTRDDIAGLSMVIGAQLGSEYRHLPNKAESGVLIVNTVEQAMNMAKISAVAIGYPNRPFSAMLDDKDEDEEAA